MWPFAPTRFSTTTGCPRLSDSFWPTTRAARSEPPPAGKATTIFTARTGYPCAHTPSTNKRSIRKTARIASVRLDVRGPDHLAPARFLFANERRRLLRGVADDVGVELGEPFLHLRVLQGLCDRG